MQKPNNYNEVKVGSQYIPPTTGGHKMVIKNVTETKSKAGRDMLVVSFDFDKDDVQPGFFTNEFKNDIRPDKKWPHSGTQYILTEDKEGKCSRSFKSFITAFEASNKCEAIWGEKFAAQFKNKKIGGVFGRVENEYNGNVKMRHELRWFCADDKADGADVPADKYLPTNNSNNSSSAMIPDDLVNTNNDADEIIPF